MTHSCSPLSSSSLHRVLAVEERCLSDSPSRHKGHPSGQLGLVHVSKPHTQAITAITVDKEGKLLATGVR